MFLRKLFLAKVIPACFTLAFCFDTGYSKDLSQCSTLQEQAEKLGKSDTVASAELLLKAAQCYFNEDSLVQGIQCEKLASRAYRDAGQVDRSLEIIEKALRRLNGSNQQDLIAELYVYQGYYLYKVGQIWNSTKSYESALAIHERRDTISDFIVNYVYRPLSNNYDRLGDFQSADQLKRRTLDYWQKKADHFKIAETLNNMAINFSNRGEYQNAITAFKKALIHLQKDEDVELHCDILEGLASIYISVNDHKNAALTNEKALQFARKLEYNVVQLKNINFNFALINQELKDVAKTKYYFEQTEKLCDADDDILPREKGKVQYYYGLYLESQGKTQEALAKLHDAISTMYETSTPIPPFGELDASHAVIEPYLFLSLTEKARIINTHYGQNAQALKHGLICVDIATNITSMLRVSYFRDDTKLQVLGRSKEILETGIDICYKLYQMTGSVRFAEQAFNYSEQSRSNLMIDRYVYRELTTNHVGFDTLIARQRDLQYIINELKRELLKNANKGEEELAKLESQLKVLELQLESAMPQMEQSIIGDRNISSSELLGFCKQNHKSILEYFVGLSNTYVFVASDDLTMVRLGKTRGITDLADQYLSSILDPYNASSHGTYVKSAYRLYTILINPVSGSIKDKSVIIIPDGPLTQIPFEAFLDNEHRGGKVNFAGLPYLLNRFVIQYEQSFFLLNKHSKNEEALTINYLGIAPKFEKFPELSKIRNNSGLVERLSNKFGGTSLVDNEATIANFLQRSSHYSIVHLYTHAIAEDSAKNQSWIAFTDDKFYEPDVINSNIGTSLIILSACETGKGQVAMGEGTLSMCRAFRMAGCNSILQAQWSVNDQATFSIIERFFHHLNKERTSAALQASKREYLGSETIDNVSKHPYFWAGLTMTGVDSRFAQTEDNVLNYTILGLAILLTAGILYFRNRMRKTDTN